MSRVAMMAGAAAAVAIWVGSAFAFDWRFTLILLLAPVVLLSVLHRPAWGLWIIVLAHPVTTAYLGPVARSVNFLLPALILGSWVVHLLWRPSRIDYPHRTLMLWFCLYAGWITFTSFLASSPPIGLMTAFRYILLALTLIAFTNLWSRKNLERAFLLHTLVLLPIAAYGIWQISTLSPDLMQPDAAMPGRSYSIYPNPNKFGVIMGHGVVILTAYLAIMLTRKFTFRRGTIFFLILGAALILTSGLIVSLSRSALLYVGIAVAVLTLGRRELRLPALATAVTGLVSLALLFPSLVMYALRPDAGISFRDSLWLAGWRMLTENPWTGTGIGAFEPTRAEHLTTAAHRGLLKSVAGQAHNVFLTNGAELGWIGLILAAALFLLLLYRIPAAMRAYQNGDWLMGAAAAGVIGLTVRAFFETGSTLGAGHVSHSLIFFLFGLLLLSREPSPEPGELGKTLSDQSPRLIRSRIRPPRGTSKKL